MEETRKSLQDYSKQQLNAKEQLEQEKLNKLLDTLAGQRHHLLGTRAVKGVLAGIQTTKMSKYFYIELTTRFTLCSFERRTFETQYCITTIQTIYHQQEPQKTTKTFYTLAQK